MIFIYKRVLRYEDMALAVLEYSERILNFLQLGVNRRVARFLASHTGADIGGVASTFRDSKRLYYLNYCLEVFDKR